MAPSQTPIWRCVYRRASCTTPLNIVKLLWKNNFDGKSETTTSEHVFQFFQNCISHYICHKGMVSIFIYISDEQDQLIDY
jgi:hypothetical protein